MLKVSQQDDPSGMECHRDLLPVEFSFPTCLLMLQGFENIYNDNNDDNIFEIRSFAIPSGILQNER